MKQQNNQPAERMEKKPDPVNPKEVQFRELSGEEMGQIAGGQTKAPPPPEYIAPTGTFL